MVLSEAMNKDRTAAAASRRFDSLYKRKIVAPYRLVMVIIPIMLNYLFCIIYKITKPNNIDSRFTLDSLSEAQITVSPLVNRFFRRYRINSFDSPKWINSVN
ncbi:hypothetical protein QTP88_022884 [Uroleucon formosanum]